jgi:hypothetical protein
VALPRSTARLTQFPAEAMTLTSSGLTARINNIAQPPSDVELRTLRLSETSAATVKSANDNNGSRLVCMYTILAGVIETSLLILLAPISGRPQVLSLCEMGALHQLLTVFGTAFQTTPPPTQ